MIQSGTGMVFDIDNISMLDINNLIDKGKRFKLVAGLNDDEYDSIEECLKDEV